MATTFAIKSFYLTLFPTHRSCFGRFFRFFLLLCCVQYTNIGRCEKQRQLQTKIELSDGLDLNIEPIKLRAGVGTDELRLGVRHDSQHFGTGLYENDRFVEYLPGEKQLRLGYGTRW